VRALVPVLVLVQEPAQVLTPPPLRPPSNKLLPISRPKLQPLLLNSRLKLLPLNNKLKLLPLPLLLNSLLLPVPPLCRWTPELAQALVIKSRPRVDLTISPPSWRL
jgi:hypothetical protein